VRTTSLPLNEWLSVWKWILSDIDLPDERSCGAIPNRLGSFGYGETVAGGIPHWLGMIGGTERCLRELACSVDEQQFEPIILRRSILAPFFAEGTSSAVARAELAAWEPRSRNRGVGLSGRIGPA
jgi:hypothetical protein